MVVLRFRRCDADKQPLHPGDWRMGWRKKTPAMRRRNKQRAEQHRQKSKKPSVTFSEVPSHTSAHDVARDFQSCMPDEYTAQPSVTSDPLIAEHLEDVDKIPVCTESAYAPERMANPTDTRCTSVPCSDNEMAEFLREQREQRKRMLQVITGKCVSGVSDESSFPSPSSLHQGIPGEAARGSSASSLHQGISQDAAREEACVLSAPGILGNTSTTSPGSADRQYSGAPPVPVRKRTPPTRQQPARAARRK